MASSLQEMEEFIHWDKAADSLGPIVAYPPKDLETPADPDSDLVPANADDDDDDFSFWALRYFNGGQSQPTLSDNFFVGLTYNRGRPSALRSYH
ncbi:hypothetical protein ColLi_00148 [Colletotrichum liriopes]|uniref:Uncharacterized protein n=1 Tax=Colletotrichum liriopes TaxID=708192 RepID=A0AA37GAW2_9PEZI|nr:hypothetical protein ColLi_00148 [Colletotrichum liriopes]